MLASSLAISPGLRTGRVGVGVAIGYGSAERAAEYHTTVFSAAFSCFTAFFTATWLSARLAGFERDQREDGCLSRCRKDSVYKLRSALIGGNAISASIEDFPRVSVYKLVLDDIGCEIQSSDKEPLGDFFHGSQSAHHSLKVPLTKTGPAAAKPEQDMSTEKVMG